MIGILLPLAETIPDLGGAVGGILGGTGFGVLVWYLVTKQIPKRDADFLNQLDCERRSRERVTNLLLALLGAAMTSPAIKSDPDVRKALEDFVAGDGTNAPEKTK